MPNISCQTRNAIRIIQIDSFQYLICKSDIDSETFAVTEKNLKCKDSQCRTGQRTVQNKSHSNVESIIKYDLFGIYGFFFEKMKQISIFQLTKMNSFCDCLCNIVSIEARG